MQSFYQQNCETTFSIFVYRHHKNCIPWAAKRFRVPNENLAMTVSSGIWIAAMRLLVRRHFFSSDLTKIYESLLRGVVISYWLFNKGSRKKSYFFSGPTKDYSPLPSSLVATFFFLSFFFELPKKILFLSGLAFTTPPPLEASLNRIRFFYIDI